MTKMMIAFFLCSIFVQHAVYGQRPVVQLTLCEHGIPDLGTISCPKGMLIKISDALYGRQTKSICPSKLDANSNCGNKEVSMSKVMGACDEKPSCTVYARNSMFGDPCFGTEKYLQVSYSCQAIIHQLTLCEHGKPDQQKISCPKGTLIEISDAFYGRQAKSICPSKLDKNLKCGDNKLSTSKVMGACDGKPSCTVYARNSMFGDPCFGTEKYLQVSYSCQPIVHQLTLCEHGKPDQQKISCPKGTLIHISDALYGRQTKSICPSKVISTLECGDSDVSRTKVNQACNGKPSCTVYARNSIFGDPCFGTEKYLQVSYICV